MARIIAATGAMIGVLFVVSLTTFAIQAALPGSAADIRVGERLDLSPEQRDKLVELVRRDLGLDRPIVIQYWAWLTHALKLDFGVAENGQSVREVIAPRIGPTLELTIDNYGDQLSDRGCSLPSSRCDAEGGLRPSWTR